LALPRVGSVHGLGGGTHGVLVLTPLPVDVSVDGIVAIVVDGIAAVDIVVPSSTAEVVVMAPVVIVLSVVVVIMVVKPPMGQGCPSRYSPFEQKQAKRGPFSSAAPSNSSEHKASGGPQIFGRLQIRHGVLSVQRRSGQVHLGIFPLMTKHE